MAEPGGAALLDGRQAARAIEEQVAASVRATAARLGRPPGLAVVLVGEEAPSEAYVRQKARAAERVGIAFELMRLPAEVAQADLVGRIVRACERSDLDGVIVQLPLPEVLSGRLACAAIAPERDADCLNPQNLGRLFSGEGDLAPCTPLGVMELLRHHRVPVEGRRAVVVGRSSLVGRPLAMLLLSADATVTIAHSRTPDLEAVCREADILVAATGRPGLIRRAHVKPGACVVDVGISRLADGTLSGDVAFDEVRSVAGALSPVPGGVGPLTVAMLLRNVAAFAARRAAATAREG